MARKTYYESLNEGLQDLCSYLNGDKSKGRKSSIISSEPVESKIIKLKIEESEKFEETVRINPKLRKQLNAIAAKYSKWLYPKEIQSFYDEIGVLGVYVPAWSYWDSNNGHRYYLNGQEVTNSLLVFDVYEGNEGKNEYNIYFS